MLKKYLVVAFVLVFCCSPGLVASEPPTAESPSDSEAQSTLSPFQVRHGDLVRESRQKALAGREIVVLEVPEPSADFKKEGFRQQFGDKTLDLGRVWEDNQLDRPIQPKGPAGAFSVDYAVESYDLDTSSGVSGFFVTPPDTMGAVGATEFFTTQNGAYRIHDKATGAPIPALDVAASDFWIAAVDPNDNGGGDPRIRFDRINDRWVIIAFETGGASLANNRLLVAVSDGPTLNAMTVWTQYFFIAKDTVNGSINSGCFSDYPTLGIDRNAIYIGANMFEVTAACGAAVNTSTSVFVIPFNQLPVMGGNISSITTAFADQLGTQSVWTPTPADNPDPAATMGYVIASDGGSDTNLRLGKISNPGGLPGTPTIVWSNVAISNKNDGFGNGVPYVGVPAPNGPSTWGLDALGFRPLGGAIVRNGRLWTAMTSSVQGTAGDLRLFPLTGDRHSVVFFEVNVDTSTLVQDGNIFDGTTGVGNDPLHVWMGNVSVNGQGHAVAGATAANTMTVAPSAVWAARLASDPLGQFSEPATYLAGTNTGDMRHSFETSARETRWGDYSQVTIDPCDDMTFFTIQQYQASPAVVTGGNWATGVARILAPAPVVTSVSTADGSGDPITISGSHFYNPPTTGMPACRTEIAVTTSEPGVSVDSVSYISSTEVEVAFNLGGFMGASFAATLTNPDGQSIMFDVPVDSSLIFADDFESGNTSAWTNTVP